MTWSRISSFALGVALATAGFFQATSMSQAGMTESRVVGDTVFTLHGNTPSMAWSPDSSRLVVNSAYTYYGWDEQLEAHQHEVGVYVVDPAKSSFVKVGHEPGYHPLWLDDSTVAWGHSPYEYGEAGLYTSPADRREIRRVGQMEGVYHTLAGPTGEVVFWSGFPEDMGWSTIDVATGSPRTLDKPRGVSKADYKNSWTRPSGSFVDQCQGTTRRAPRVNFEGVWAVHPPDGAPIRLAGQPYVYDDIGGAPKMPAPESVVAPCVSPDGKKIAWITKGREKGDVVLQIKEL